MADYFDTGVLVKYYTNEPDSARAIAQLASATGPIYLPPFLQLELKNALRTKHGRGEITAQDLSAAEGEIIQDIQAGRFVVVRPRMAQVMALAEVLSAAHAATHLSRTLDTLHVAIALLVGSSTFHSFDARQKKLATTMGLTVKP